MITTPELTSLWNLHAPALVLLARSRCGDTCAEDCVQEAFVRLATQPDVPVDPVAWLVRVVRNAAIDSARSTQRRVRREKVAVQNRRPWLQPDPASRIQVTTNEVESALQSLEELTREIIIAHLWNNLTFRQIAAVFDLAPATAHRRYEEGIAELRSAFRVLISDDGVRETTDETR